jgi:hypothetical protein
MIVKIEYQKADSIVSDLDFISQFYGEKTYSKSLKRLVGDAKSTQEELDSLKLTVLELEQKLTIANKLISHFTNFQKMLGNYDI